MVHTKFVASLAILVLVLGVGSFALGHSADAQPALSAKSHPTKHDIQKGNYAKLMKNYGSKGPIVPRLIQSRT